METQRFRLRGPSLEELRSQAFAEHGPLARIIAAELVTVGGIRGFFAQRHYEVTVEVPPDPPVRTGRRSAVRVPAPERKGSGIAALLAEADDAEAFLHGVDVQEPSVSTDSNLFAALMDDLIFNTDAASKVSAGQPAAVPVPAPATRPGDLTVVVGLGADALNVARSMAEELVSDRHRRAAVRAIGDREGTGRRVARDGEPGLEAGKVTDRLAAAALRAGGVEGGFPVFVAVGLAGDVVENVAAVAGLGADQVWVVVDAGRKPMDTAAWVSAVTREAAVTAVAVVGTATTSSPQSVNALGIPVGWVDGRRATSPVL